MVLAMTCASATTALAEPDESPVEAQREAQHFSVSELFEDHRHQVISVETELAGASGEPGGLFPGPDGEPIRGEGSGFIITSNGEAITNWHVIAGAQSIQVTVSDGSVYSARLIGADPNTDVALLQIDAPRQFDVASLGTTATMSPGQWVFAIGSPFGLEQSITLGVLSAKGRQIGVGPYDDFLQTDAAINPGNSGGPLYNLDGEVIGVNTAVIPFGGIGFAVPIDTVTGILPQLRDRGYVVRGYMGTGIQEMTPELAATFDVEADTGVLLRSVDDQGPADEAGLQAGDIATSIAGVPTPDSHELLTTVGTLTPGETVTIEFIRDGQAREVLLEVDERPDPQREEVKQTLTPEPTTDPGELGVSLIGVTPGMAQTLGLPAARGAYVDRIQPGSPASGILRQSDVLLRIGDRQIRAIDDVPPALEAQPRDEPIRIYLHRRGEPHYVAVRLPSE